jgi:heme oxygenase
MHRSWMLGLLAQQTQRHHATADGDRLAMMEKPTRDRYRELLAQIYCFEAPIEAALVATDGIDGRILRSHLKTSRLAGDLDALSVPAHQLTMRDVPRFEAPADALGWLWVLHRNTLLHGLIQRYLVSKLPDTAHAASSYLSAFDGRAGALMRELGAVLDQTARRVSIAERIVAAANEAFRVQRQWYRGDVLSPLPQPAASRRAA